MIQDNPYEQQALEAQDRIASMTDNEVVKAYAVAERDPQAPWALFLAQAIAERNIA